MEIEIIIIIVLRLIAPLLILRFPFWGVILALFLDAIDVTFVHLIGGGTIPNYQPIDKALDGYYYTIALIKVFKWEVLPKFTSIVLYAIRIIGLVLFEILGSRVLLFIFPNIFEFWFIFWAARNKWFPAFELTKKKLAIILGIILIPKLFHEYMLHIGQWCDKPYFNLCGAENWKIFKWMFN